MRSMFEYMGTMIVMILISFIFMSFISIEMQEIAARNYHTRVVETIEYAGDYENEVNNNYGDGISLTLNQDNTIKVVYNYQIKTPFFGTINAKEIIGYAR